MKCPHYRDNQIPISNHYNHIELQSVGQARATEVRS